MVLPIPTGEVKAVEPAAPYFSSLENLYATRTDKDILTHQTNFGVGINANDYGNEMDYTKTRLKGSVIGSKIPSPAASSSIASLFEEYFGSTTPSNSDTMVSNPVPNISPFSTSTLFETLSISTTYSNNNAITADLTSILGLDSRRVGVGVGGQLPSDLQIPMGTVLDNSLNPISYFVTLTIRF